MPSEQDGDGDRKRGYHWTQTVPQHGGHAPRRHDVHSARSRLAWQYRPRVLFGRIQLSQLDLCRSLGRLPGGVHRQIRERRVESLGLSRYRQLFPERHLLLTHRASDRRLDVDAQVEQQRITDGAGAKQCWQHFIRLYRHSQREHHVQHQIAVRERRAAVLRQQPMVPSVHCSAYLVAYITDIATQSTSHGVTNHTE